MLQKSIAENIPHKIREQILLEWLPDCKPAMSDEGFKLLWEAYFIYIDPNGVRKETCEKCLNNVLNNWKHMQPFLIEAERNHNMIAGL